MRYWRVVIVSRIFVKDDVFEVGKSEEENIEDKEGKGEE